MPEPVSGSRAGQVDHIHVHHEHHGKGIAKAMIDLLCERADDLGWTKLVLNAPRLPEDSKKLYGQIASLADWSSFIIRFE